jgi:hypothetical protein
LPWTCRICGEEHDELPLDVGFDAPVYWDGGRNSDDYLTPDFCVWTDDDGERAHFVRGVLKIPLVDSDEFFAFGIWASLSEENFDRAIDLLDEPHRVEEEPYFGWLSNRIAGYPDTVNLKTLVHTSEVGLRPVIELEPSDHPLSIEQQHGITLERVQEIVEPSLHTAAD